MKSLKETVVAAILLVAVYAVANYLFGGCLTPSQSALIAKDACTLIEANAPDGGVVDSICATAPEVAEIATAAVQAMMDERADAGRARKLEVCKHIPGTGTCATDAELAAAIKKVKAER